MAILDVEATFQKLDKLRERMDRLEKAPVESEWQLTRNLIQSLIEAIAKSKMSGAPVYRKIRGDAPAAVLCDWQELVLALQRKGVKSETRRKAVR